MLRLLSLLLWVFVFIGCQTVDENKQNLPAGKHTSAVSADTSYIKPPVTIISDLADSLKPKQFAIDTMPPPERVALPTSIGKSLIRKDSKGNPISIPLEPPTVMPLKMLRDKNGELILDQNMMPFILGLGGRADFTNFSSDDGLANDGVNCSAIDSLGNLWFGSMGAGITKYDGKTFSAITTAHGLINNNIWCISVDSKGNIWIGTNGGGVSKYDGKNFVNYTMKQGLAKNAILDIQEDKFGQIWFATGGGGLSVYDPSIVSDAQTSPFKTYSTSEGLANNMVLCITDDHDGNLWVGTSGGGISRLNVDALKNGDKNIFTNFNTDNGLASNFIKSCMTDKNGQIWMTSDKGVSRYNPNISDSSKIFSNFSMQQGLPADMVNCCHEDQHGNLWFGTATGGIAMLEKSMCRSDDVRFLAYTNEQGLCENNITSILSDDCGNIWFGSKNSGLSKYQGASFTNFSINHGLPQNMVRCMTEDHNGNLWFGTFDKGISKYDGKSFTHFTESQGLISNMVLSVMEDQKGNIWIGTQQGVSCFDGAAFTNYTTAQGLSHNIVRSILEDKNGNIWFGTNGGGVTKLSGSIFTQYNTKHGLGHNTVRRVFEDRKGNIWFGTYGGGVARYDGESIVNFTTEQGLAKNQVISMREDVFGNMWFGTDGGGVNRISLDKVDAAISDKDAVKLVFENFSVTQGLADNVVYAMTEDSLGNIIIGTNLGFTFIPQSQASKPFDEIGNHLQYFNFQHGFPVKDMNTNSILCDKNGIVWAGTGSEKTALVRFDPLALHPNTKAPRINIQKIKINEKDISWYSLEKTRQYDSITIPSRITDEISVYGKELSTSERENLFQTFSNISFDGIVPFHALPENLVLPYEHNTVTFEFVSPETGHNNLVIYQYMLEGYSQSWSPATNNNQAVFGNIDEGSYTFFLKAKSPDGIWSDTVTYKFRVLPPWYRTWWAYCLYIVSAILALVFFVKRREAKLVREKLRLEKTVEIRTAEVVAEKKEVEKQKQRSEELLLNILPEEVAEELKEKGSAEARMIDQVTVLFTDFKGFTQLSEKLTPKELVAEINECFSAFDHIMTTHHVEKIKTIGDAYMAAGGLPTVNNTHAVDVVKAALDIQKFMEQHKAQKIAAGELYFEIRIGVHTGPVVAGIVGIKKFAYDIWGDTVNTASRMESSGEISKVNISGTTYELVKNQFACTHRGKVVAKGKGEIDMYFVESYIG